MTNNSAQMVEFVMMGITITGTLILGVVIVLGILGLIAECGRWYKP